MRHSDREPFWLQQFFFRSKPQKKVGDGLRIILEES
jgi:hypothetical protein